MSTTKKAKTKVSDMLVLATLAYLLTIVSPVLGAMFNPSSLIGRIIVGVVCAVVWILGTWALAKTSKKECGFDVMSNEEKPTVLNWVLGAVGAAAFIAYCLFVSDGFEMMRARFSMLDGGADYYNFFAPYFWNIVQALVITLIVTFAQKAGDIAFGLGKYIPYGGFFLGICWSIANFFTSLNLISNGALSFSDVLVSALIMLAYGVVFGIIYLLSGKKPRCAFIFIALALALM